MVGDVGSESLESSNEIVIVGTPLHIHINIVCGGSVVLNLDEVVEFGGVVDLKLGEASWGCVVVVEHRDACEGVALC